MTGQPFVGQRDYGLHLFFIPSGHEFQRSCTVSTRQPEQSDLDPETFCLS